MVKNMTRWKQRCVTIEEMLYQDMHCNKRHVAAVVCYNRDVLQQRHVSTDACHKKLHVAVGGVLQ